MSTAAAGSTAATSLAKLLLMRWRSLLLAALLLPFCSGAVMNVQDCQVLAASPNWANIQSCNPPPDCRVVTELPTSLESRLFACDSTGRLIAVQIDGKNLTGTLPKSWSSLSSLKQLKLNDNHLTGTLPAAWSGMSSLQYLYLYNNRLAGTLPTSWSAMRNLVDIWMTNNDLTGALPASWSALEKLGDLELNNNHLTGALPASWSAMTSLRYMWLNRNRLKGTLPATWSKLSSLKHLWLNVNNLTGTLPASWSTFTKLVELRINDNHMRGTLPSSWSAMGNLEKLLLFSNSLTGTLPASWSSMSNLTDLWLFSNSLTGTLPGSWSALVELVDLELNHNHLVGTVPTSWKTMDKLRYLWLQHNRLSGTLPASWSAMISLEYLWLNVNSLEGTLPVSWSTITNLTELRMNDNHVRGTLPPSWSNMRSLKKLLLYNNSLAGTLPASWSAMSSLTDLWLYTNSLTGTLPASWSQLSNLVDLELNDNRLAGTLPSSWSALKNLRYLWLFKNRLVGKLPADWSAMTSLQHLWLFSNKLEGTIPASWNRMSGLLKLFVARTQLCGVVPNSLQPVLADVTELPACPGPKPPPKSPSPKSPPGSAGRCGRWFNNARCSQGGCCSRWGWCGRTRHHCHSDRGCQSTFGICTRRPAPPSVKALDTIDCGADVGKRCQPGYCCSSENKCSSLVADCSPLNRCQEGYGMCYFDAGDLQSEIDKSLDPATSAAKYASTKTSNATLLSFFSFHYPGNQCSGKPQPCINHVVKAGQTVASVAAQYGTNTWQLLLDNPLLEIYFGGAVSLRPYDQLAVRPAPGVESIRWAWTKREALILGSVSYPRPCSGYPTDDQKMSCFCNYHSDGSYVWPFSTGDMKCRQVIECRGGKPVGRNVKPCPKTTIADDSLEYNGNTRCLTRPANFDCSTGDGCWSALCFCREFLLADGTYLNPFDSTRRTALVCDHTQPGWYGGLYDCEAPNFFDPVKRLCTTASQAKVPFRRGYTSCDGVPDADAQPTVASTGRRKLAALRFWRPTILRRLDNRSNCRTFNMGKKVGCIPCDQYGCKSGRNVFLHIVARKTKKCQCHVWGYCPIWFNRGCRFSKPRRK